MPDLVDDIARDLPQVSWHAIRVVLQRATELGWTIVRPEDCCVGALGDLDAEFWTPDKGET